MSVAPSTPFRDASTECAICLSALDDGARTIALSCGHRWHLACLQEQLEHARPSHAKRLIFSGCRCAKCGAFCEHPELENLTRRTDALRERVDDLVAEQLEADAPDAWRDARNDAAARARLIDEGRRSYAFYLCDGCDEPYFGGTVDCADEVEGELTTSEERLCNSCSPKSQLICQKALEHRAFHVWKCRYCCNPSKFVCYGNVHFCDSCHARNSQRVRSRGRGTEPPALEAIPCTGEGCPFPKPEGRNQHSNGSALECEQVYCCASCETCPSHHAFLENPGSRNFVGNPSGEDGLRGWRMQANPGTHPWAVESTEIRVDENTTTNFVSSYQWCVMSQTVPLHRYVSHPSEARLEVSAKFMGRTDCPSVFKMGAIVTNAQGRQISWNTTSELVAPADFWEKATLTIEPLQAAHQVTIIVCGKDSRFWRGRFGSKVCHCSVRVLGTAEELGGLLVPEQNNDMQAQREPHQGPNYAYLREPAFRLYIVLPVLVFIFLWLIRSD